LQSIGPLRTDQEFSKCFRREERLMKNVFDAIRAADQLLPGEPVEGGEDPRWQAILRVGDYIESEPDEVWSFIHRWGSHANRDLRAAVATCLLEHLLQYHFDAYFPRVEEVALADASFGDTFLRCWPIGQANQPANVERFNSLQVRLRELD
jgi:hypothetical protein